jgi:hypothetical protein
MKQIFLIFLNIAITNCLFAQALTKYGEITNTSSNYVNANGTIGGSTGVNKNGQIVMAGPSLGSAYQGGIIFYIFVSGDPGYVAGEVHGLIAASADLVGSVPWGCSTTDIPGTVSGIGYGKANTTLITNGCATAGIAARLCADLTLNGYSDWYLPSIDELNILITNKDLIGGFFSSGSYWSSSQQLSGFKFAENAYYIYAGDNSVWPNLKANKFLVRPVRSF